MTAPQAASAQSAEGKDDELPKITVTARQREELQQSVPLSITSVSAEQFEKADIVSVEGTARLVPNLQFDPLASIGGASNAAAVYLRGIGQNELTLTIDPGVGLFVDGVYLGRAVGSVLDLADISRVEVLRGPQTALFGKNTLGGAISISTRSPDEETSGLVSLRSGSASRFDVKASAQGQLAEGLRGSLSLSRQYRDGYVKRLPDVGLYGEKDSAGVRAKFVFAPSAQLEATLVGDYTRIRESTPALVLLSVNPNALFPRINNLVINGATCGSPSGTSATCYNGQWLQAGRYSNFDAGPQGSNIDVGGVSLTTRLDTGPVAIKSITAYRAIDSRFSRDADHSPLRITETDTDLDQHQFSQEFQFSGQSGRVRWLAGAYYLNEGGNDVNFAYLPGGSFQSGGRIRNDNFALFGQFTFELAPDLNLTASGRQNWDKKRFLPDQLITSLDPAVASFYPRNFVTSPSGALLKVGDRLLPHEWVRARFSEFTPAVSVDYRLSPQAFAYASFSRGFKSGGFTQRVFPPDSTARSFNPEHAETFEVGLKLDLFRQHLRLNTALFTTHYRDIQSTIIQPGAFAPRIENAGDARIKGFETEIEVRLFGHVRLSAGLGYLDAHYTRVDPRAAGVNFASKLINAPEWSGNVALDWELFDLFSGPVSVHANASFRSAMFRDAQNTAACRTEPYGTVDASLRAPISSGLSFEGGVTNISGRAILMSCFRQDAGGFVEGAYSRPREWFVSLTQRF